MLQLLGAPPPPKGTLAIARVHTGSQHKSSERKWAHQRPIKPSVPFCHRRWDTKMPVDKPLTDAKQWYCSGTQNAIAKPYPPHAPPPVTFRRVVVSLQGPGQSPVLPFACCVGSLRSVGRCGRCSRWCRFHVRGAPSLVCRGCAGCGGMCRSWRPVPRSRTPRDPPVLPPMTGCHPALDTRVPRHRSLT